VTVFGLEWDVTTFASDMVVHQLGFVGRQVRKAVVSLSVVDVVKPGLAVMAR